MKNQSPKEGRDRVGSSERINLEELSKVPEAPGVYIFRDKKGRVLYVGKAKNLRNRIRSYFLGGELEPRKQKMTELVGDFSYIETSNEFEALVLEANLIKQHRPPFNVILRDDKNYPYIKITVEEDYPRIEVVRKLKKDGSLYFGPYVPAQSMWEALSFIRRNFPIRTCKYDLSKPIRPCIQYQIKRCPAPCARLISREEYMKGINDVVLFLKGRKTELLERLRERMFKLSEELRFEEAAVLRDQISRIEKIFEKQRVVSQKLEDMDVIGIYLEDSNVSVNVLFVRNGLVIGSKDYFLRSPLFENLQELLSSVIESLYIKESLIAPPTVIVGEIPENRDELSRWLSEVKGTDVLIRKPDTEEEREVFEMALSNAKSHLRFQLSHTEFIVEELKDRLKLRQLPLRIGAFDISNLFGVHAVGSFVYWEEGNFNKNYYRHLRIRDVEGIDDYAMMRENVIRVIKYFDQEGGIPKPDLILIDGGKGHLNTVLKLIGELSEEFDIFAIAKEPDRLISVFAEEISLDDTKPSSLLLRKIRDEAHRFAISYHRKLRTKAGFDSPLEQVPGIGEKRRLLLLRKFGSISRIKEASPEEIAQVPGFNLKLAQKLLEHLKKC